MRSFIFNTDAAQTARGSLAPEPSDHVNEVVLTAGVSKTVVIPAGAQNVLFSANNDFRARFGTLGVVAAIPTVDVTNGTAAEMNPSARRIPDTATHIAIVASEAANVTLSFFGA